MDGCINGWMLEKIDGWMNQRMDGCNIDIH